MYYYLCIIIYVLLFYVLVFMYCYLWPVQWLCIFHIQTQRHSTSSSIRLLEIFTVTRLKDRKVMNGYTIIRTCRHRDCMYVSARRVPGSVLAAMPLSQLTVHHMLPLSSCHSNCCEFYLCYLYRAPQVALLVCQNRRCQSRLESFPFRSSCRHRGHDGRDHDRDGRGHCGHQHQILPLPSMICILYYADQYWLLPYMERKIHYQ